MSVEERPGVGCRGAHRPRACALSSGSAPFVPPDTTRSDYGGELSPSFCTVTSERISDAQSAFLSAADAAAADTNSSLRPRSLSLIPPPPPPSPPAALLQQHRHTLTLCRRGRCYLPVSFCCNPPPPGLPPKHL